jgi:hypothetical protein
LTGSAARDPAAAGEAEVRRETAGDAMWLGGARALAFGEGAVAERRVADGGPVRLLQLSGSLSSAPGSLGGVVYEFILFCLPLLFYFLKTLLSFSNLNLFCLADCRLERIHINFRQI